MECGEAGLTLGEALDAPRPVHQTLFLARQVALELDTMYARHGLHLGLHPAHIAWDVQNQQAHLLGTVRPDSDLA